jgi:hypothetical protein
MDNYILLLPYDIQHIILEFEGSFKCRNNKYIQQISRNVINNMESNIKTILTRWIYEHMNNGICITVTLGDIKELLIAIFEDKIIYNYYSLYTHSRYGKYIRN